MKGVKARQCFDNELVVFSISGYLPGEYVLRVFPLIVKSVQFSRFSLSLLGPLPQYLSHQWHSAEYLAKLTPYLEGEVYGISSRWRDLQRIVTRGHTITNLKVKNDEMAQSQDQDQGFYHTKIEQLYLSQNAVFSFSSLDRDHFPMLTKLVVDDQPETSPVFTAMWRLPLLTSLTINMSIREDDASRLSRGGPPSFAHTLRSINTTNGEILDLLAPHCRNLLEINYNDYHNIMGNNPGLTALKIAYTPWHPSEKWAQDDIDLTPFTQLKELDLRGPCGFGSKRKHPTLHHVSFNQVLPGKACELLKMCPGLQHLSVTNCSLPDIVSMTALLNPSTCKQLTINPSSLPLSSASSSPPTTTSLSSLSSLQAGFAQVKKLMESGFHFNQCELLLQLILYEKDRLTTSMWEEMMEMFPAIKNLQTIQGDSVSSSLIAHPSFFASFHALSIISLQRTSLRWNQENLSSLGKSCPVLRELKLETWHEFKGVVELQSTSLYKLHLGFTNQKWKDFNLQLPSLTHLSLHYEGDESIFFQKLLNGDPLLYLPLLHVLCISLSLSTPASPTPVVCEVGHSSLAHLRVRGQRAVAFSSLTLQRLPSLRSIDISPFSSADVCLDIPGECDVDLVSDSSAKYIRQGLNQQSKFVAALCYDARMGSWITKDKTEDEGPPHKNVKL